MFDVIYIEKSLGQKEESAVTEGKISEKKMSWIQEFLQQNPDGKIEYVENFEIEAWNNTDVFSKVDLTEKKAVLIGETKHFLERGQILHIPVLAVLTKEDEELFSFPYAVNSLSDISLDYLDLIQCRFEKRPYTIAKTQRLRIMEMNDENAIEYFRLREAEPAFFLQGMDTIAKSKPEIEECARAYISHAYPFYGYGIWAVYEKETDSLVGFAGVEKQGEEEPYLNLSYYIKEAFRNKGYATECCLEIIRYMKEEYGEEQLCCVIEENNSASLVVAGKLGVEIRKI